jgi:hypothetical protein
MEDASKLSGQPTRERWSKSFEDNVAEMRDAGRWVIGVVAGLLLAATNLSGLGRLSPNEWRFWLAAGAAGIAVTSVGRIITLFLRIQVRDPQVVESLPPEVIELLRRYGLLLNYESLEDFRMHHQETLDEYNKVRASIGRTAFLFSLQHNNELQSKQQDLLDQLEEMAWMRREIEALISWGPARERFERARRALLWFGIVAATASLTLVWAVNPPESRSVVVIEAPT